MHPAEEGGFLAEVPALPGCFTQGETIEEIAVMTKEAIGFVKGLIRGNHPLPIEKKINKKKKLQSFSFPLSVQVRQKA